MKRRYYSAVVLALLISAALAPGQEKGSAQPKNSKIGLGFNVGLQKPYCDVLHTGAGLAGEFMMRYLLGNYFDFSLAFGYGTLNDGFSYNTFVTDVLSGDIKANIHLSRPGSTNPYLFIGAGFTNSSYTRNKPWAIGSQEFSDKRTSAGAFIYGGGVEFMITPQVALNTFMDYRFSNSDALDGAELGKYKDGYLNARVGLTYYLSPRSGKTKVEREDLLALQQGKSNSGTERSGGDSSMNMFEAKLDKMESGDAELSMEQYVRLKSRVDELNQLITIKETELDELRSTLDFKNQRIADLETTLQRSTPIGDTLSGGFSYNYEEALRAFYARDYNKAASIFSSLLTGYPNHTLASNCQYWIGECFFALRDYQQASAAFQAIFNYQNTTKKDDATLMLGRCFFALNDKTNARDYFQAVIDKYPGSEYIEKARQWLRRL
ncbi:MAG TPA: tol-pal system protein YbgF [bacterium]|nr:tol-pal system protein YbgF [bacterium]HQI49509.1 tol-pal system protein YbgF [bacterium]HQJ64822.1 tol-pal system protein YbgF [bacterium]